MDAPGEGAAQVKQAMWSRLLVPSRRRARVYGVVLGVLAVLFLALDGRGWLESRLFYFPSDERIATPLSARDVTFKTSDGLTLHGWLFMPAGWRAGDAPVPAVLHAHGNAGNVGLHFPYTSWLAKQGFAVLLFDYRGYGRSEEPRGRRSRDEFLIDTRAALDFLVSCEGIDASRIAVMGQSLGGAFALGVASDPRVRAVVTVSAFAGWKAIARSHAGRLGSVLVKSGLDGETLVAGLGQKPYLIVHGTADTIVPFDHARRLQAAAGGPARAPIIAGVDVGHNEILIDDAAMQSEIAKWLLGALAVP